MIDINWIMLTSFVVSMTSWIMLIFVIIPWLGGRKFEWWVEHKGTLFGPVSSERKAKRMIGRRFRKPKGWKP